jgi:uncharacterized protein (DUF362 family)/ferredoxin-like protein FixX
MTQVSIIKTERYNYPELYSGVKRSLELLGGIDKFVKKGNRVLIKPNLLASKSPEDAVTTHPIFVKAVINLVKEAGGIPYIGDSPSLFSLKKVTKKTGMEDVAAETGAQILEFVESVTIPRGDNGNIFKSLEIAKELKEIDVIINLPKLKTHVQMYLTLGVKNLFGCIIGKRKAQWHLKAGVNNIYFAKMIVELYEYIRPSLTIVDGIIGMEGDGPSGGVKRDIGLTIAGADAVAVDAMICHILGGDFDKFYTHKVAKERNTGETDINRIEVLGEKIEDVKIRDFKFPSAIVDTNFSSYPFIGKHIRNFLISKPREDRDECTLCSFCIEACPPQVIKKGNGRLIFNYDECIRCFCCSEVCPEDAMKVRHGFLHRILGI